MKGCLRSLWTVTTSLGRRVGCCVRWGGSVNNLPGNGDCPPLSKHPLRRPRLGVCPGDRDDVYVADASVRPPRVYVLPRDHFVESVRGGWIRARQWCAVIPRRNCLVKRISLPACGEDEARRMLEFEVPSLVPTQDDGLCYDVAELRRNEDGTTEYLAFLSPRDRVEQATAFLREAGVTPDEVTPDSVALCRWLGSDAGHPDPVLMLCVEPRRCQVLAISDGRLQGARELVLADGEAIDVAVLLAEAQRVCSGEIGLEIGSARRVVLAGSGHLVSLLASQLRGLRAETHDSAPVETVEPSFDVLDLSESVPGETPNDRARSGGPHEPRASGRHGDSPVATRAVFRSDGHPGSPHGHIVSDLSLLSAIGCALEGRDGEGGAFNLSPTDWREGRLCRRQRVEWAKTIGLTAAVPVLLWSLLAVQTVRLNARCGELDREMAPIEDVAVTLELKKRQAKLIQSQLLDRSLPLEVMAELYSRVPEGLGLSYLMLDLDVADPRLNMKGPAKSLEAAFAFPLVLEESPLFADVRPEAAQQVSRGQGVLIEFGCRCRIVTERSRKGR